MPTELKTNADMRARLQKLHELTAQTPLFNPVFQLSLDISRSLEGGASNLRHLSELVSDLECDALQSRAHKLNHLLAPVAVADNLNRFRAAIEASSAGGFEAFADRWSRPFLHIVYTAHPTFLLTAAQSDAVAAAALSRERVLGDWSGGA